MNCTEWNVYILRLYKKSPSLNIHLLTGTRMQTMEHATQSTAAPADTHHGVDDGANDKHQQYQCRSPEAGRITWRGCKLRMGERWIWMLGGRGGVKERDCVWMVPCEGQRGEGLGPYLLSPSTAIPHVGPPTVTGPSCRHMNHATAGLWSPARLCV